MITMANIEDRTDKMRTEMYLSCGSLWNLNESDLVRGGY